MSDGCEVTYVECPPDWKGIYVGDELAIEGHSIYPREWIDVLGPVLVESSTFVSDVRLWSDYERTTLWESREDMMEALNDE